MTSDPATMCCFCAETIQHERPVLVTLTRSDPEDKDAEGEQSLFAHAACLRAAVHPSVPLLHEAD